MEALQAAEPAGAAVSKVLEGRLSRTMQSIQTLTKMSSVLEASAIPTKGAAKGDSGIIGFHYPNSDEVVDKICSAGFLGNYYDVGHAGIGIEAPIERRKGKRP